MSGYKLNIHNGSSWENILNDGNIIISDPNNHYSSGTLVGALDEIYNNKVGVTSSITSPTSSNTGYAIGHIWINTLSKKVFVCLDGVNGVWGSMLPYVVNTVSTSSTLSKDILYLVDSSSGSVILTLPPSPVQGDKVEFSPASDWNVDNFDINGNGNKIQGSTSTLTVDISKGFKLVYSNVSWGWGLI